MRLNKSSVIIDRSMRFCRETIVEIVKQDMKLISNKIKCVKNRRKSMNNELY